MEDILSCYTRVGGIHNIMTILQCCIYIPLLIIYIKYVCGKRFTNYPPPHRPRTPNRQTECPVVEGRQRSSSMCKCRNSSTASAVGLEQATGLAFSPFSSISLAAFWARSLTSVGRRSCPAVNRFSRLFQCLFRFTLADLVISRRQLALLSRYGFKAYNREGRNKSIKINNKTV